ncbi:MAG: sigma-70 family RNA polymerase sigma factor [bacterium]
MDESETDEALVAQYTEGDEWAFETLVGRHLKPVYSFVVRFVGNKEEAEDIVQETFLKAWKSIKKYEPKTSKFKTWIMRIARNTAIDYLRKKKHIPFSQFSYTDESGDGGSDGTALFAETVADSGPLPDELFAATQNSETLEQALARLTPPYREALLLHYQSGLTFLEIGEALGEPPNTVKSRHHRALKALRIALEDKTN